MVKLGVRAAVLTLAIVVAGCGGAAAPPSTVETTVADADDHEVLHQRWIDCLEDRGFAYVEISPPPDPIGEFPSAQTQLALFRETSHACNIEIGRLTGDPIPPPSPEHLAAYYWFLIERADCVSGEGYEVASPPSLEAFVEAEGLSWTPYEVGLSLPEHEWSTLNERCPQDFVFDE